MKKLLLAAATLAAAPLSAQQASAPVQTGTIPGSTTATTAQAPAAVPARPAPTPVQPAPAAPVPRAAVPATTTGAGTITPAPANSPTEVAAIVAREFPAYDKDRNGALTSAEFSGWMLKLKTIADPTLQANAPATRTWLGAAFAQADADRSQGVTLPELTGFLTPARL